MARMSIDDMFLRDQRVEMLADILGHDDADLTRSKLLHVFAICYDRRSVHVDQRLVNRIVRGLAEGMVDAGLATLEEQGLRVHGAEERIAYLERQSKRGQKGGQASAAARSAAIRTSEPDNSSSTYAQAQVNLRSSQSPSPDSASSLLSHSGEDLNPPGRETRGVQGGASPISPHSSSKKRQKRTGRTYDELDPATRQSVDIILQRLEARSGVCYTPVNAHVDLIVARLSEGYSEIDLRAIIGWVSDPVETGGRGWEKDEKWRAFIQPKTLFGPRKVEEYIDPARAWLRRNHPGAAPQSTDAQEARDAKKMGQVDRDSGSRNGPARARSTQSRETTHQPIFGGFLDDAG